MTGPTKAQKDAYLERVESLIAKHGHMVQAVMDEPPFSYTVGLAEKYGFELIMFGVRYEIAASIFNAMADTIGALHPTPLPLGEPLPPMDPEHPMRLNTWANMPVILQECRHPDLYDKYVVIARHRAGHDIRVIQVVLPDRAGRFPHDPEFSPGLAALQPLLYTTH